MMGFVAGVVVGASVNFSMVKRMTMYNPTIGRANKYASAMNGARKNNPMFFKIVKIFMLISKSVSHHYKRCMFHAIKPPL
jgi:hypothetical protein